MMAAMGFLTLKLSTSVQDLYSRRRSCLFCSERSYNCKKGIVLLVSGIFVLIGIANLVFVSMQLAGFGYFNGTETIFNDLDVAYEILQILNLSIFGSLTIALCYFYACMRYNLNQYTSENLQ